MSKNKKLKKLIDEAIACNASDSIMFQYMGIRYKFKIETPLLELKKEIEKLDSNGRGSGNDRGAVREPHCPCCEKVVKRKEEEGRK